MSPTGRRDPPTRPPRGILLGPQRLQPTLREATRDLVPRGEIALVAAGWEEREGEDGELREHVGREVWNLEVYGRGEDIFRRDPELFQAMRDRYDTMRRLQDLYRLRLHHAMAAARELLGREAGAGAGGDSALLAGECEAAIEAVRALDAHHLCRVRELNEAFEDRWKPWERESVARHRDGLAGRLADAAVLAVAGGHVAILRNRMRLLGVLDLWGSRPLVAWSAGAMALSTRVVLFHDAPPQGAGDAEVLDDGLGAFTGIVPLPHASQRLSLDDPVRVGLFARRFGPDLCVALDPGARVDVGRRAPRIDEGGQGGRGGAGDAGWTLAAGTRRLTARGTLREAGQE